jgi:CPA2 family monovalent cation:H+ antiporter-2
MEYTLISTIVASIVTAFIFGIIAKKLNLPAIFGYLIAGIVIGPHTPGFVADLSLAQQLSEIGIILLMFGVGLHFSIDDLLNSRRIALPGAIIQMVSATLIGGLLGVTLGYDLMPSLIFGFSLSVASTIVLLRSLEQRGLLSTKSGKIAISWLIIEDIAMVIALVMIPVLADMMSGEQAASATVFFQNSLATLFKVGGFFVFMYFVGKHFLPWLLVEISKMKSPEISTLGTLAIALGFASIAYVVFDASLALGAFLAGVMLGETEIGKKSADNTLSMRDTFSVIFFVSVGMLFDPATLIEQPIAVILTLLIIVVAKSLAAIAFTTLMKQTKETSMAVAAGLAQIGEFSFILGGLALSKGLIPQELYNLILAGALISIVVNPFLFKLYDKKFLNKSQN